MKKLLIFFILCAAISNLKAQEWLSDFEQAKKIAAEKNHNIVLVFQGSDWCAPCMKLDREIWSTDEFKSFAKDHFVMLQADFPRRKANQLPAEQQEKNKQLAERYNQNGYFPFVVVLNKDGKVLGETSYKKMPPADYIKLLVSFN